ncbi:unnamed protein product [Pleuronectes platessa]|uniref:Uncharacterized protein n=1 Tax=Pleuronectes platessa TaxID=8262 RepID=A0A9N7UB66_PLEPL|nr:unnamed protein product [Pleuronectes platessa]
MFPSLWCVMDPEPNLRTGLSNKLFASFQRVCWPLIRQTETGGAIQTQDPDVVQCFASFIGTAAAAGEINPGIRAPHVDTAAETPREDRLSFLSS